MDADKSILLQKQVRDNSEDLQSEFLDMKHWEDRMKKAETELLKASGDQILPPVRRKKKAAKDLPKPQNKGNSIESKRIKSSDYSAWEKFDVNKACEEVERGERSDKQEEDPLSKEELEKNHAEATLHKNEGNNFVKKQLWDKALACYSKAVEIFPYDAVFFANRALCHLKMDNLYSADADCTAAVQLDEFYVKAYHRRATARISLKQYEEAAQDINKILKLEPSNKEAQTMLARVNKSIENSKPLIMSTTRNEILESTVEKRIGEKLWNTGVNKKNLELEEKKEKPIKKNIEEKDKKKARFLEKPTENDENPKLPNWIPESHENFKIVKFISKPPHQRSKKPLRTVPIEEIEFGKQISTAESPKILTSCEETIARDEKIEKPLIKATDAESIEVPSAPKTAVQFLLTWRKNKSTEFRYQYFKQIRAESMPNLFQDSMESNTFSEILKVLRLEFTKHKEPVFDYLKYLSEIKRFRTLTMFMSKTDKDDVQALFDYSEKMEGQSDDVIKQLRIQYEI